MTHMRLSSAAIIIAILIGVAFMFSVPRVVRDGEQEQRVEEVVAKAPEVELSDSYKKGVHTIMGSIVAPNACTTLTAEASHAQSADSATVINLAITTASNDGVCLQLPTKVKFTTSIEAPADVLIQQTTVNGVVATTIAL